MHTEIKMNPLSNKSYQPYRTGEGHVTTIPSKSLQMHIPISLLYSAQSGCKLIINAYDPLSNKSYQSYRTERKGHITSIPHQSIHHTTKPRYSQDNQSALRFKKQRSAANPIIPTYLDETAKRRRESRHEVGEKSTRPNPILVPVR